MTDPTKALEYSSAAKKIVDQLPRLAEKAAYTDYIRACVTLAWKMVIQRPKMMYNTEGKKIIRLNLSEVLYIFKLSLIKLCLF